MSKNRYTQYSKFSGEEPEPEVEEETVKENKSDAIEQPLDGQTTIPEVEPEIHAAETHTFGKISNCKKLNVRKLPSRDSEIISELIEGSEVMIDEKESTALFYKICTEHGIEGFCMKQFVKVLP